uniref:Putative ovule protein n=1 Tax=Solanum chacoense TaxID=4108 RepID=A0A0V0GTG1_SOLCH
MYNIFGVCTNFKNRNLKPSQTIVVGHICSPYIPCELDESGMHTIPTPTPTPTPNSSKIGTGGWAS